MTSTTRRIHVPGIGWMDVRADVVPVVLSLDVPRVDVVPDVRDVYGDPLPVDAFLARRPRRP